MSEHENFVRTWQKASSAKEAAQSLGMSMNGAYRLAYRLRRTYGIPLKRFPPNKKLDVEKLKRIALESLEAS